MSTVYTTGATSATGATGASLPAPAGAVAAASQALGTEPPAVARFESPGVRVRGECAQEAPLLQRKPLSLSRNTACRRLNF